MFYCKIVFYGLTLYKHLNIAYVYLNYSYHKNSHLQEYRKFENFILNRKNFGNSYFIRTCRNTVIRTCVTLPRAVIHSRTDEEFQVANLVQHDFRFNISNASCLCGRNPTKMR